MFGAIVGGLGALAGGLLSSHSKNKATASQHAIAMQELAYQKELHKNQVQWRVEDAKKAGIHPLAALGLSSASYSPVSGSIDTSGTDYSWLGDVGQNLNRAIQQGKTQKEREQALVKQNQYDDIMLRKANAEADLAESTAASERLRLHRELFPSAPKANQNEDPQLPSGNSITPGTTPLLGASRLGNTILLHFNPEIADTITEDFVRNHLANMSVLAQTFRLYPEIARKFTKDEQNALLKGDAQLEIIGPGQIQFQWRPHMKPKYSENRREVSGRIKF